LPKIKVTGACTNPPTDGGSILFPQTGNPPSGRVVVTINNRGRVLTAGRRTDAGNGACVNGTLLHAAGGEDKEIEWRQGHWFDVYRYDKKKLWGALAAVLTLAASVALAFIAFTVDSSSAKTPVRATAVIVLLLSFVNSVLTFVKDLNP
jgi:hypothetical protein